MRTIQLFFILTMSTLLFGQQDQKRLSVFGEVAAIDFSQTLFTLDARYRLTDDWSISSWNQRSSARAASFGGDFSSSASMLNYKLPKEEITLSIGYVYFKDVFSKIEGTLIKIRFKII